jgi:hypothetical protein
MNNKITNDTKQDLIQCVFEATKGVCVVKLLGLDALAFIKEFPVSQ